MGFFDFLASNYKVESVIGLLSFTIAAFLGFLAFHNSVKMKRIAEIIAIANTKSKSKLATALLEVLPPYEIPDLTQDQGFKIIKMQMEQKAKEFGMKMNLLKLGILLFSAAVLVITIGTYIKFTNAPKTTINGSTVGPNSSVLIGDGNTVNYTDTVLKKGSDTTKLISDQH